MDKETKALIDFYDNRIKDLENKNKEKQDKLDKIENIVETCSYNEWCYGEIDKSILNIIKGEREMNRE